MQRLPARSGHMAGRRLKTKKGDPNMKRYMNTALFYAILAMAGGVFYREFTKFNNFA